MKFSGICICCDTDKLINSSHATVFNFVLIKSIRLIELHNTVYIKLHSYVLLVVPGIRSLTLVRNCAIKIPNIYVTHLWFFKVWLSVHFHLCISSSQKSGKYNILNTYLSAQYIYNCECNTYKRRNTHILVTLWWYIYL